VGKPVFVAHKPDGTRRQAARILDDNREKVGRMARTHVAAAIGPSVRLSPETAACRCRRRAVS